MKPVTATVTVAQPREQVRPQDLQRLQDDLANLDEELRGVETQSPKASRFREREEAIAVRVSSRGEGGRFVAAAEVELLAGANLASASPRRVESHKRHELHLIQSALETAAPGARRPCQAPRPS